MKVYIARRLPDAGMKRLKSLGWELRIGQQDPPSSEELAYGLAWADAAIITLTERVSAEMLKAAPELKIIATYAVGYDNIDVEAAQTAGIIVTNTPGVLTGATADLAFTLMLDVARRVTEMDRWLRTGHQWEWGPELGLGLDVSGGTTVGLIGFGRIGQAMARRAAGFDMEVLAYSRSLTAGEEVAGARAVEFEELLTRSDVVSLHCPLTAQTRHLIDANALRLMGPESILVNTARGGIVDDEALADSLEQGRLAGAGLDVFEGEPQINPRLLASDRVVVTPHIGSAGRGTRNVMSNLCIDNVQAVLQGREPLTPVHSG